MTVKAPSKPTGANISSPVLTPTRTASPPNSSGCSAANRWISSPARTAREGSSPCATGAPKIAINSSPTTLVTDAP